MGHGLHVRTIPKATFSKHITVVTAEDNDGVMVETALLQCRKNAPNAVVDVANSAIIRPSCAFDLVVGEVFIPKVAHLQKPLTVRILLLPRNPDLRQRDIYTLI